VGSWEGRLATSLLTPILRSAVKRVGEGEAGGKTGSQKAEKKAAKKKKYEKAGYILLIRNVRSNASGLRKFFEGMTMETELYE